MKAPSCVIGAVAFAIVALSSNYVNAQDVIVQRGNELEGAVFTADVVYATGGACTGDYTFASVPSPVVQSSQSGPDGECAADGAGDLHQATCSGSTLSKYTTFDAAERDCKGTGVVVTDVADCVSDPSFASNTVCFATEAGGLLAKGRIFDSLDLCQNGDYFTDSVQYWGQYVPPEHANKCMAATVGGNFVKHSCGTSDGDSFSTYYTDAACTNVTVPTGVMVPGEVSRFGTCKESVSGGFALVFEECVTFIEEGAGGRAELTGGLAVFSMFAALSLLLNYN